MAAGRPLAQARSVPPKQGRQPPAGLRYGEAPRVRSWGSRGRPWSSPPVSATASSHGPARVARCNRHALTATPSASTASASGDPAGRAGISDASIACAHDRAEWSIASARRATHAASHAPSPAGERAAPRSSDAQHPQPCPAARRRSPPRHRACAAPTTPAAAHASSRTPDSTPAAAAATAHRRASALPARARAPRRPAARRSQDNTAAQPPGRPPPQLDRRSPPTRTHAASHMLPAASHGTAPPGRGSSCGKN